MKKLFLFLVFSFFPILYTFTQELSISVEQLLRLKNGSIEKTSDDDNFIGRQYFVFKHHPDDPNYGMIYTQDYEEEYFFINNKLYFIMKEYRATENQWKSLLAGYLNKYEYTEQSNTTPDGSWFINTYTFNSNVEQYQVFIYRPSQRWNTVYKFAPGEALVRVIGKHYQFLKEYQAIYSSREAAINNAIKQKDYFSPYFDGIPINLNLSQLENQLKKLGYKQTIYRYSEGPNLMTFQKHFNGMNLYWSFYVSKDSIVKNHHGISLEIAFSSKEEDTGELAISLFREITEKINSLLDINYTDSIDDTDYGSRPRRSYTGKAIEYFGLKKVTIAFIGFVEEIYIHFDFNSF